MVCMQLTDYSAYAAQLAWWLAFFPPEQFLILTVDDLRSPRRRLRVRSRMHSWPRPTAVNMHAYTTVHAPLPASPGPADQI